MLIHKKVDMLHQFQKAMYLSAVTSASNLFKFTLLQRILTVHSGHLI